MRSFFRWLLYIAGIMVGVVLFLINLSPAFATATFAFVQSPAGRWTTSSIAALLMISPLMILLRYWQAQRRSREISYTTDNGRISVNLIAIEEALTRAIEGEPEVKKAHVRVYKDKAKGAVVIDAVMTLWEVPNVTERNRFCQRLLRRRFAELMPEQATVLVNLNVHRLNVRRPDAPAASVPVAAPATPVAGTVAHAPTAEDISALRRSAQEAIHDDDDPARPFGERPGDDDLYVGPTYPVMKEEDDDATVSTYHVGPPKASRK